MTVYLVGRQEAPATNAEVQLYGNGAWVEEDDETWTCWPYDVIDRITGFKRPI